MALVMALAMEAVMAAPDNEQEPPKPIGKALKWSPAHIADIATRDSRDLASARAAWRKDAPEGMKDLLDARPPRDRERL
jgi:hypothetical protein